MGTGFWLTRYVSYSRAEKPFPTGLTGPKAGHSVLGKLAMKAASDLQKKAHLLPRTEVQRVSGYADGACSLARRGIELRSNMRSLA